MPEIGMSGLMSGDRKRSVAIWPKPPRLSSTLCAAVSAAQIRSRAFFGLGALRDRPVLNFEPISVIMLLKLSEESPRVLSRRR